MDDDDGRHVGGGQAAVDAYLGAIYPPLSDHDPLCPATVGRYVRGTGLIPNDCQCALIARVRADERERMEVDWNGPARADIRRALRADLRAKVKARLVGTGVHERVIADVLALIDGHE